MQAVRRCVSLRISSDGPLPERAFWRLETISKISLCSSSISVTNTACDVRHFKERMSHLTRFQTSTPLIAYRRIRDKCLLPLRPPRVPVGSPQSHSVRHFRQSRWRTIDCRRARLERWRGARRSAPRTHAAWRRWKADAGAPWASSEKCACRPRALGRAIDAADAAKVRCATGAPGHFRLPHRNTCASANISARKIRSFAEKRH
jgi:hypothetical protein